MILVVCLNPAIDVTYTLGKLVHGNSHRVAAVARRAGGKGLNVACVARRLGEPVTLIGLAGPIGSTLFVPQLERRSIAAEFTRVQEEPRQTITVVDRAGATVLNEPGPQVTREEWIRFLTLFRKHVDDACVVVLSGSLPPGVPDNAYAELATLAKRPGAFVIVDCDGRALRLALDAQPDVVKPNSAEAAALLGRPVRSAEDARDAADTLRTAGAKAAIVSRGEHGLVAVVEGARRSVTLSQTIAGNPTGAGDALVAAIAFGLARRRALLDLLCDAVAISAAAVAVPYAGGFDPSVAARLRPSIRSEEF